MNEEKNYSSEESSGKRLSLENRYLIDTYLSKKYKQALTYIGIGNFVALVGIAAAVSGVVSEIAAQKALTRTEELMSASSNQLEILSKTALETLVSSMDEAGKAKAQALVINGELSELKKLKAKDVNDIVKLMSSSEDEIKILIETNKVVESYKAQLIKTLESLDRERERVVKIENHLTNLVRPINCTAKQNKDTQLPQDNFSSAVIACTIETEKSGIAYLSLQGVIQAPAEGCTFSIYLNNRNINQSKGQRPSLTNNSKFVPAFMSEVSQIPPGKNLLEVRYSGTGCWLMDPDINGVLIHDL